MGKILPRAFFERPAAVVAEELIGKTLTRGAGRETRRFRITEAEAYDGEDDLACHASKGRTKRTETMFGAPGHWYVYLIYGMHEMLNIVVDRKGYPAAILLRSIEGLEGPGRLTRSLGISRALNGKRASKRTGLWIEEGERILPEQIERTPRIGVAYAGEEWADKPLRFVLKNEMGRS